MKGCLWVKSEPGIHIIYHKKLREGRRTGDGLPYVPWLTGHEFASQGAYVRMMGYTVPRMYTLLSHLESDVFRIYDHMEGVSDIDAYLDMCQIVSRESD